MTFGFNRVIDDLGNCLYSTNASIEVIRKTITNNPQLIKRLEECEFVADLTAGGGALAKIMPQSIYVEMYDKYPGHEDVQEQDIFEWQNTFPRSKTCLILSPPPQSVLPFFKAVESQADTIIIVSTPKIAYKPHYRSVLEQNFRQYINIVLPNNAFAHKDGTPISNNGCRAACIILFRRLSNQSCPSILVDSKVEDFMFIKESDNILKADVNLWRKGQKIGKEADNSDVVGFLGENHIFHIQILNKSKIGMIRKFLLETDWRRIASNGSNQGYMNISQKEIKWTYLQQGGK